MKTYKNNSILKMIETNYSLQDVKSQFILKMGNTLDNESSDGSKSESCEITQAALDKFVNISGLINITREEACKIILDQQKKARNVSYYAEIILIFVYAILIFSGLIANLLVSFVVARKTQMHTARNLYIVNLTVSDIILCVICMPFTLIKILSMNWTLGLLLCKLVPFLQGTNIMVSIGTITVIALDRYFTIVRRSSQDAGSNRRRVITSIVMIWVLSIIATLPLFFHQKIESFVFESLVILDTCIEDWNSGSAQLAYTVSVLLLQSIIPALVVGTVHARIASYLHKHAVTQTDSRRATRELERNRRTTLLLTGIAVLFAVSWLPLNLHTLLLEVNPELNNHLYITFAICHIIAMTSAVSNPILYGWLNSNIRHEFLQLLPGRCASSLQRQNLNHQARNATAGGPVTTLEDTTTRTQLNTLTASPHSNHHQRNGSTSNCRESITLLLTPTNIKHTAAVTQNSSVSLL